MKVAVEVVADRVRVIVGRYAPGIAAVTRTYTRGNVGFVSPGSPGGKWGWEPINAWMFETPGARHPLFGDRERWYAQPYRPFLEQAAEVSADEAAQKYLDKTVDGWARELGYK